MIFDNYFHKIGLRISPLNILGAIILKGNVLTLKKSTNLIHLAERRTEPI